MFKKIILSYFPENEIDNNLSPIKFHLNEQFTKIIYENYVKHYFNNKKALQIDSKITYYHPDYFLKYPDNYLEYPDYIKKTDIYYSYKISASLNTYNNYSIHTILTVVDLISLYLYYDYINDKWGDKHLETLLNWINYLVLIFFSHLKEFPYKSDKKNINFITQLLEKIIFQLEEYTKETKQNTKDIKNFIEKLMNLLKTYPDFLIFLYNISKKVSLYFSVKPYTNINLYEYLMTWKLVYLFFSSKRRNYVKSHLQEIKLKKWVPCIDEKMITLLDITFNRDIYSKDFLDDFSSHFLPYFINSLSHLKNISLNDDIENIIEKTLNFKTWWINLIQELQNFNKHIIKDLDITIDQSFDKIQEIITKGINLDDIKMFSKTNENVILYITNIINTFYNWHSDYSQFEFLNNQNFKFLFNTQIDKNTYNMYILADKNYYFQNPIYNKEDKHKIKKFSHSLFPKKIFSYNILVQATKSLLSDFNKKTHIENISSKKYKKILKQYFYKDINLILNKWIENNYLNKYYWNWYKNISFTKKQFSYFRWNIYYPDFLVWYQFLKFNKKKIKKNKILVYSRLKESLFWYLILKKSNLLSTELNSEYINSLLLSSDNSNTNKINFDLEWFYQYFDNKYPEFLEFFYSIKENREFISIFVKIFPYSDKLKNLYVWDNLRDISYYNKKMIKL
jgi:hypothetical protein